MIKYLSDRVILFEDSDVSQGFDKSGPYIFLQPPGGYGTHHYIDSFPCYHHDMGLVCDLVAMVESRFPVKPLPHWFVVPYEDESRTNGLASKSCSWVDEKRVEGSYVLLHGKRIVIHPAMTRYLVGHEYGHIVDYYVCHKRGYQDAGTTEFDRLYADMREIKPNADYGARKWHRNIGEIIANDFRICVTGLEREFWPHEVQHPDKLPKVHEFWYNLMLEYGNP